ncbi:hypothetical protein Glove_181g14 [Diversispora epigaea]|uniref:Uncharacterized protein n=1 Tax=Diversispora epigaea TaxID=1348612 RepID=A0A397ISM5_9GLOM|nr:hypothetical protein Glove_181g14 [Diversispora epigaea]
MDKDNNNSGDNNNNGDNSKNIEIGPDKELTNLMQRAVSSIAKQVLVNPDIARKQCKVKKKSVLNYLSSTSESSSNEKGVIKVWLSELYLRHFLVIVIKCPEFSGRCTTA